ncbi:hypothetical protein [Rufibacter tibetensis]|nr:hypothetical protein [Rufibacter tibetensis]
MSYGLSVVIVFLIGVSLYFLAHDPPTWVYLTAVPTIVIFFNSFAFQVRAGHDAVFLWECFL